MSDSYIKKFYKEICDSLEGNYKIILESNRKLTEEWLEYDSVKWVMDESIEKLVKTLKNDSTLNFEDKILIVYNHICLNYIYDANVLFFFRKDISEPNNVKYIAVDWYGRIVDEKWIKNRQLHNRRVCYEFARFYAKAINELVEDNYNCEACMVGDVENLHYVVGITGDDYSAILDLDNFNSIKDLTRLKLGLTIKGIKILSDDSKKLYTAIEKFNKMKPNELVEIEQVKELYKKQDISIIQYFEKVLKILSDYNIDSQGIFEYMRLLIEQEAVEIQKLWKEVKSVPEKRYERCISFVFDGKLYLLDSVQKNLRIVNTEALKTNFVFNPIEKEYPYYGG